MSEKRCLKCGVVKDISEFSFRNKTKGTKHSTCKDCHNVIKKKHYSDNKVAYIDRAKAQRVELQQWYKDLKASLSCELCGEDHPATIQFHHESDKEINIANAVAYGWSTNRIEKEIEKCIIVCANCHFKIHWEEREELKKIA